ncbi:MAG TPA: VOC family protein, partial [Albitalea sp.]|nr:VOC family protein [Albitalea sp.]
MSLALDHLVVAARTLDEGVHWCEATFGIAPQAGGRHPSMGTHNRVFSLASSRFPKAYLEIIAIDPQAAAPGRVRWFDLDAPALQAQLAEGPQLIHWVMRCDDIDAQCEPWRRIGVDRGEVLAVE